MHRRLATRELYDFWPAFGPHVVVEHLLDFLHREAEARRRVGKTERTIHVARTIDLNDAQASVLFVIRAKPAIVRASIRHSRGESERDGSRFVELRGVRVELSIAVDERLELAVLGASPPQVDFAFTNEDVAVKNPAALRADGSRQLIKNIVCILLRISERGENFRGSRHELMVSFPRRLVVHTPSGRD